MVGIGAVSHLEENTSSEAAVIDGLPLITPPPALYPRHHPDVTIQTRIPRPSYDRIFVISPVQTSSSQPSTPLENHGHGKSKVKSVDDDGGSSAVEKEDLGRHEHQGREEITSPVSYHDSEKGRVDAGPRHVLSLQQSMYQVSDESLEDLSNPGDHVFKILIHLSTICPLLTLLTCFYTAIITFTLILSTPIYLCFSPKTLATRLRDALNPPLDFQLRLIYSVFTTTGNLGKMNMVLVIHFVSPFYAVFIALSAWVAAAFWLYAGILGNPDGRGKDDGRETVLGVRRWWERWLERGL